MKHAMVIGGTRGIGKTVVQYLVARGNRVSVLARAKPHGTRNSRSVRVWPVDITNEQELVEILSASVKMWGKLDSLVFSQRFRGGTPLWPGEIAVTLTATDAVLRACEERHLMDRNSSVVVVGSLAGHLIVSEQPAVYHASKAAVEQLVRFYAVRLGPMQIRVNGVSPGITVKAESAAYYRKHRELTSLYGRVIPLRRMGTSDDVAATIGWLCGQESAFVTGQIIVVDGGLSLQCQDSLVKKLAEKWNSVKHER